MKAISILLFAVLFTGSGWATQLDDLILVSEEYPPLNYSENGVRRGIASDLLIEMLAASGSLQSHRDIASLPWARGYQMALKQKNVLLFSITKSKNRTPLFQWVGPILKSKIVLLAHKKSHINIENLSDIETNGYKVGVVLNDIGHQLLKEEQLSARRIYPYNRGLDLTRMLAEERLDLIAYDALVSRWNLAHLGYKRADFEIVYTLQPAEYYYALSRKTDPEAAAILQKELDRLRQSGRVKAIIAAYLD